MKTFAMGFLQVFLVSISTYAIAHQDYILAFLVSFGISWVWTANVRKANYGSTKSRITYALGAAFGTVFGIAFSVLINLL